MGEILADVVAEALRQGAALSAPTPEPKAENETPFKGGGGRGGGGAAGEQPQESRGREGDAGVGFVGDTIEEGLGAKAERSGWNTSVHFLEKRGAVRLRLVRQSEKRVRQQSREK